MPSTAQLQGHVESLALTARSLGGRRVSLGELEGDEAFRALCEMGATVTKETCTYGDAQYLVETARLRVHWVDVVARKPASKVRCQSNGGPPVRAKREAGKKTSATA